MNDEEELETGLDVLRDTVGDMAEEDDESEGGPLTAAVEDALTGAAPAKVERPVREMLMRELEETRRRLTAPREVSSSPLDRLIERFSVPTGKSGSLLVARRERDIERAREDEERRKAVLSLLSKQEQLESADINEQQRIEAMRARAAQPRRTGTSEFERLTAALQSDIPEEQKKLIRQRIRMLTERPTAAKDESDLPTGQLGQYVQARRILADPEASPADKEAAEAFIANSNKGKLSKANETQKAMLGNIESSFINIFDTLSKAEKIIDENPQSVTGVAAYLSYIPATDARTLSNYIQTIKANIGFDELQKMRMASPTGGALGQVAVQELQFLQSKIATLDQFADRDVLLDQLAQIRASYNRWRDTVQQFYDEADAGLGEGETPTRAPGIDLDAAQKALERKRVARGAQ